MSNNENSAKPHQPLGRTMLLIAWALVFAGLIAIFGGWEEKQLNPNQDVSGTVAFGVREITLQGNRYHHYVANGEINGQTVTFLIDTGATDVSVPEPLANKLGLRRGMRGYAQTANGTVEIYSTVIDKLTLGNLEFYQVDASINPGMQSNEVLLGMSALRQIEMIHKDNKLTLRQTVE